MVKLTTFQRLQCHQSLPHGGRLDDISMGTTMMACLIFWFVGLSSAMNIKIQRGDGMLANGLLISLGAFPGAEF